MKSRHLSIFLLAGAATAAALSCGGAKSAAPGDQAPGEGHDLDTGSEPASVADAGAPPADAAPPAAPVTFVLKNSGKDELALNMDRGWAGVLLAWSGKPPKASPILMFPKACTMACSAAEDERCPLCVEPDKVADIRKAQKLEKIAPGAELAVPWDGMAVTFEKTKGKRDGKSKKCDCWTTEAPPAESYTVRACGLRLTTSTAKSSQLVCAEGQMTLPVTGPIQVVLDFVK